MRIMCCTIALLTVLQISSFAQSSAVAFAELRTRVLERVQGKGVPKEALSRVFGLSEDMRLVTAAEMAFPERHDFAVAFSIDSTDVFLTESRNGPNGRVTTVFHTDLTLALRGAASGADMNNLQVVSADGVSSQFREVLSTWDRHLPSMLERMRSKAASR